MRRRSVKALSIPYKDSTCRLHDNPYYIPEATLPQHFLPLFSQRCTSSSLAYIGTITLICLLYKLQRGLSLYAHKSTLPRYLHGENAWALVTGASQGIGGGFAEELAHRGFDVVRDGRNAVRLEDRKKQLELKLPSRQFQIVIADAGVTGDAAIKQIDDLVRQLPSNLTVLINNVGAGGGDRQFAHHAERPLHEIAMLMARTEGFMTLLTAAMLPRLN